jgi:TusE/DsrC/DsvC family sulfur relay protein
MAIEIAGRSVDTDTEGFLARPQDWTPEIAQAIARGTGIVLSDRHWKVIEFCRGDFAETGQSPGLRRITKVGGVPTKELYELFPGGPGKLSAKIAGLRKPTGCL